MGAVRIKAGNVCKEHWILSKGKWEDTQVDGDHSSYGLENEFGRAKLDTETREEVAVIISLFKPQFDLCPETVSHC